jgi:hypothetical protein
VVKVCRICKQEKPEDAFEWNYTTKHNSRRHQCKTCRNVQRKTWESRHGDGLRDRSLKRLYGMTREDYHKMSEAQDNKCYICNKINDFGPWKNKLVVDHNHKTDEVRKLLCDKCNKGLGQFNDDIELLLKAADYIKQHTKV